MNIIRLLFELFVIYLVYKLIFDFIIPIYRTTKQVRSKMDEMNQRMADQRNSVNNPQFQQKERETSAYKPASEDYIDYEEIK